MIIDFDQLMEYLDNQRTQLEQSRKSVRREEENKKQEQQE